MIIKKFLAKTEKEAIEMAKEELGSGAIVMNIKKVQPKGLSRLFVKGKVEVTAALDEGTPYDADAGKAKKEQTAQTGARLDLSTPKFVPDIVANEETEEDEKNVKVIEEKLNSLQKMIEKQISEKVQEEKKAAEERREEKEPEDGASEEPVPKETSKVRAMIRTRIFFIVIPPK